MSGNTLWAGAEDRVRAVEALGRGAARAGDTPVARRRHVTEVQTPRALQKIAADRCHVAQLRGGTELEGLADHRDLLADNGMRGEIGHPYQGSDRDLARSHLDRGVGERVDVDQSVWTLNGFTHQIDKRGSSGDVTSTGRRGP